MTIKELFEKSNGSLTYEEFANLAKEAKANFTDLSEGKYVSRGKYDDDLQAKANEIDALNSNIAKRDSDLGSLKEKLEQAGADAEALKTLNSSLSELQNKYDADTKAYKAQLKKQAYEFAVKEFASTKKFSSKAAQRDFINSLIAKDLKMEGNKILGAEDFAAAYSTDNADAFVVEAPQTTEAPKTQPPQFVASTSGGTTKTKQTLSQMMAAKNENPDLVVDFD